MTGTRGTDGEPRLPPGAPNEVRDFVAGLTSTLEIDTSDLRWLPHPVDVPLFATPSVRIRPGSTTASVGLQVTWGRSSLTSSEIDIAIVGGSLRVVSDDLPSGTAGALSQWVAGFNEALRTDNRQLDSLRVHGPLLIVTSRSSFPPARASSTTPVPVALAGLMALRRPPTPVAPWTHRTRAAKLLSAIAIVFVICGGAAVVAATWLDDSDQGADPPSSTESTASTAGTSSTPPDPPPSTSIAQDLDCPIDPGADICVLPPTLPTTTWTTSSVSTTSTTSTTTTTSSTSSTTTTTTLPPGPCANDPDADVATCGPPPGPPPPGDSSDGAVQCVEPDVPVDRNNDGIIDDCIDVYTDVIPPTGGLPPLPTTSPPRPIPATGSDSDVPLQLGVLLILAGLIAMVAGHRRASDARR